MRLRWKIMSLVNLTVVITLFLATLNISIAFSMSEAELATWYPDQQEKILKGSSPV